MDNIPPIPLEKARSYKGHPQPSVDERLHQAKIFLADEDLNRCLGFSEKLQQIEEYLEYVKKESLICNAEIFDNVQTMAKIQRDWVQRMDAGPLDTPCCDPPALPNISTRLVDVETARKLAEVRERTGLVTQMREDHAPFTVKRSTDQSMFLNQFRADSGVCPDLVDESENLLFVETEAYKWALSQPSLIPRWMHDDKGLPNRGSKLGEQPQPWYRQPAPMADSYTSKPINRPPKDQLPEYLLILEILINKKLKEDWYSNPGGYTHEQWREIQDLMYIFEPEELQEEHTKSRNLEAEYVLLEEVGLATPVDQQQVIDQRLGYKRLFCEWVELFRDSGIQIKISRDGMNGVDLPGVFYVPTQAPQHTITTLQNLQDRLRTLLSVQNRDTAAAMELVDILLPYLPADVRTRDRLIVRFQQTQAVHATQLLQAARDLKYQEWVDRLERESAVGGGLSLRLQLPGARVDDARDILSSPWPSPFFPDHYGNAGQIPPTIKQLEANINDQLYEIAGQSGVPGFKSPFGKQLRMVMFPRLRKMAVQFLAWKPRVKAGHADIAEVNFYNSFKAEFEETFTKWVASLKVNGVKARIPSEPLIEEDPQHLYFRGKEAEFDSELPLKVEPEEITRSDIRPTTPTQAIPLELDPENIDFEKWEENIAEHQRRHMLSQRWINSSIAYPGNGALYKLLADLQYPRLKELDLDWRKLNKKPNISEDEKLLRGKLLQQWRNMFFAWQQGFGKSPKIKQLVHPNEENTRYATGDPGVVYYRGPFPDLSEFKPWEMDYIEPTDELPDAIKQDQAAVRSILNRQLVYGNVSLSQDDRKTLTEMFEKYWEPAQAYAKLLEGAKTENPSVTIQRDTEQRKRRKLFIQQCVTFGFQIVKMPDKKFMARDTTADTPDLWKIDGTATPTLIVTPETDLTATLHHLYLNDFKTFRAAIAEIEEEMNVLLRSFETSQSTAADKARVIQLINPFLPRELAELGDMLNKDTVLPGQESAVEIVVREEQRQNLEFRILGLCRMLSYASRVGGIRITIDSTGVGRDSLGTGEMSFPVSTSAPEASESGRPEAEHMDLDPPTQDPLPTSLRRTQDRINHLLQLHHFGLENITSSDELRGLWRIVMTPSEIREDDELRALDERSRDGILDEKSHDDFDVRQAKWHQNFKEKVREPFGLSGIQFVRVREEVAARNHFVPSLDSVFDLPPEFRSKELPPSITTIQEGLNTYIRSNQTTADPYYDQILDFLWQETSVRQRWREMSEQKLRQRHKLTDNEPLGEELRAELRTSMNLRIRGALSLLKNSVRYNSQHLRLIETARGVYDFVLENDLELGAKSDDTSTQSSTVTHSDISNFIIKDISGGRGLPGLDDASDEYYRIAGKIKNGILSDSERAEAALLLTPLSSEQRKTVADIFTKMSIKYANNDPISEAQEAAIKNAYLRVLWENFGDSNPEVRALVISTTDSANPYPIQNLLKNDLFPWSHDGAPTTPAEAKVVAKELNLLLASSQNGELSEEEDASLDFVLRSFATGHLAELYRQIEYLNERQREPLGLTLSESIVLARFTKQFKSEWKEWKISLPLGAIILDDIYVGPEVINSVVQRYRVWQEARRESDKNPANHRMPMDTINMPADSLMRELYDILKESVMSVTDTIGKDKLMLDRIPASLQRVRAELTSQLTQIENHGPPSLSESLVLKQLQRIFIKEWLDWFNGLAVNVNVPNIARSSRTIDFTGKAERRGVQRAAIELALNLLATNQEQHRPTDKFRKVKLAPRYKPPRKEVSLSLPLHPWQRPIEVHPFKYSKLMRKYHQLKDLEYSRGQYLASVDFPANLPAPSNRLGPYTVGSDDEVFDIIKKRQNYLLLLQSSLLQAAVRGPRPIIHTINKLIDEVCRKTVAAGGSLNLPGTVVDDELLTSADLDILRKLTHASWYEGVLEYPHVIPGIPSINPITSKGGLLRFENDVKSVMWEIPFWSAPLNQALDHPFDQPIYDPQIQSMAEDGTPTGWFLEPNPAADAPPDNRPTLLQHINTTRSRNAEAPMGLTLWNVAEATVYLNAMSAAHKIYFGYSRGRALIARIPPNAHPETKFFVSREEVERSPSATHNMETNAWEVTYDSSGTKGIAIIQPNKYEFLQDVARRLGRDIGQKSIELTKTHHNAKKLTWAMTSLSMANSRTDELAVDRKDISIMNMARDITKIAPDLAHEAEVDFSDPTNVSARDCGKIVQMQALEEANNCWEPRFSKEEHIWDWAAPRLNAKVKLKNGGEVNKVQIQFFNLRRWPLACQSAESQRKLKKNTLLLQEKPRPEVLPPAMTREEIVAAKKKKLQEEGRHTGRGQPPSFTFGETPIQQSYQSMIIENHLADVDEFYPKPNPPGFVCRAFGSLKRKVWGDTEDAMGQDDPPSDDDPHDKYKLPKIPKGWRPDSVSEVEKRHDVAERLMKGAGFPNTEALYFSAAEVARRQDLRVQDELERGKYMARDAIEKYCGMEWKYIKQEQRRMARIALDIDPVTERFRPKRKVMMPRPDLGMGGPPPPPPPPPGPMPRPTLTTPGTPKIGADDVARGDSSSDGDSSNGGGGIDLGGAARGEIRGGTTGRSGGERGGRGRGKTQATSSSTGRQPRAKPEMSTKIDGDRNPADTSMRRPTEASSLTPGGDIGSVTYPQLPQRSPTLPARNTRSRSPKKRTAMDAGGAPAGSPMKKKSKKQQPRPTEGKEEVQVDDEGRRFTEV